MSAIVEGAAVVVSLLTAIKDRLESLKPKDIQLVRVVSEPYTMTKTRIGRLTTSATTRPQTPNIEIKNPIDSECRILSITLIPDATFKTEGMFLLKINDVDELEVETQADLTDFSTINVPIANEGKVVQKNRGVKIFAWNPSGNPVKLTAQVHFVR